MDKTTTEQMNDLVAQIVKEDSDVAALDIFASAIALATGVESNVSYRVGELADEIVADEDADEIDDEM